MPLNSVRGSRPFFILNKTDVAVGNGVRIMESIFWVTNLALMVLYTLLLCYENWHAVSFQFRHYECVNKSYIQLIVTIALNISIFAIMVSWFG